MKTVTEMKNVFYGLIKRLNTAEEGINEFEEKQQKFSKLKHPERKQTKGGTNADDLTAVEQ